MGFIGRSYELGVVAEMFDGHEQALVVTGELGMGKSALLSAIQSLYERAFLVKANAHESQWPYSGLHMVLDALDLPELCEKVQKRTESLDAPSAFEVAIEVLGHVREARYEPTFILIDNADQFDDESKQVIGILVRRLRGSNVRVVLTKESKDDFGPFDGLPELALEPLNLKDSMALAMQSAVSTPNLGVSMSVAQYSHGVPLAIVEIMRSLGKGPSAGSDPLMLPLRSGPLADNLVQQQLQLLSKTAISQLQLLSCAYVTPLETFQWLIPDETTTLDELIASGIVRSRGGLLSIQSQLIRTSLYWSMEAHERADAHRQLAEVLRMANAPVQLWHESFVNPSVELAPPLVQAALQYLDRGALECAIEMLERGRTLAGDDSTLANALEIAAQTLLELGQVSHALRYEQGLRKTQPTPPTPEQALLALRLNFLRFHSVDIQQCHDLVQNHGSTQPGNVGHVLAVASFYLVERGDLDTAKFLREHALLAKPVHHDKARAMCLVLDLLLTPPPSNKRWSTAEVAELLNEIEPLGIHHSRILLARVLSLSDDYAAARALLNSVLSAGQDRLSLAIEVARLYQAENEYRAGHLQAAMETVAVSLRAGTDPNLLPYASSVIRIWYWGFTGNQAQQRQAIEELNSPIEPTQRKYFSARMHAILGRTYLDQGNYGQALQHLTWCRNLGSSLSKPNLLRLEPDLVEVHVHLKNQEEARKIYELFKEHTATSPNRWAQIVLPRCEALLLDGDASLAAFQAAENVWDSSDSDYERMRTFRAHAQRLSMLGASSAATQKHDSYSSIFGNNAFLGSAPRTQPLPLPVIDQRPAFLARLSGPEQEVVELAIEGLTNKEIAKKVQLSVRGVEARLRTSYEKLGVKRKSQLFMLFGAASPTN
ncbi:hypothetical protein GCM10009628_35900 [Paeniglutamicibacter kerguelensis]|nr:AAA family ATPase [Paeniglutamicibacter kerguelensis]